MATCFGFPASLAAEALSVVYTHDNGQMPALLQGFERDHGIALHTVWMDQNELKSRLATTGVLGVRPDVIIAPQDIVSTHALQQLRDIRDFFASDDPILAEALGGVPAQNLHALPLFRGNHLLLYYNKSLVPEADTRLEDIVARKAILPDDVSVITWSVLRMYWFVPFMTAEGAQLTHDGRPNLNSPEVARALREVWQLIHAGYVDMDCTYECTRERFSSGEAAYTINGIWAYDVFLKALGPKLGVAALPSLGGRPMRSFRSQTVAIFPEKPPAESKRETLALFANYLLSAPVQAQIMSRFYEIPVVSSSSNIKGGHTDVIQQAYEQSVPMPEFDNAVLFWDALIRGFVRYGAGALSAEAAVAYMQNMALHEEY